MFVWSTVCSVNTSFGRQNIRSNFDRTICRPKKLKPVIKPQSNFLIFSIEILNYATLNYVNLEKDYIKFEEKDFMFFDECF